MTMPVEVGAGGGVNRLLHLLERLRELDADLRQFRRIGLERRGVVHSQKRPAHQLDVDLFRQLDHGVVRGFLDVVGGHGCGL